MKKLCVLAALAMPFLWMPSAHADSLQSFASAAMAPVLQVTQDGANASFHPQGEGDVNYAQSILDSSHVHAFSTVFWPGAAAGNLGTLLAVTGQQPPANVDDPVRAEVDGGSGNPEAATTAPSGSSMSASVKPEQEGDREARASTSSGGGALGPLGTVGAMSSTTKALLRDGKLAVNAQSSASGIDLPGTIHIDSVISSASATTSGGAPQHDASTVVHGMTIGGQQVYVDANGVHTGAPGKPSDPAAVAAVNTALNAAGVQVYFTAAHDIVVGQVSYYYASSVLFFFAPPGDTGKDSFSLSVGGAAVAVSATPGAGGDDLATLDSGSADDSSSGVIDTTPAATATATPVLDLPAPSGAAATVTPTPVHRAAAPATNLDAEPVAATTERGLGGWPLAVLVAALAGGVLLARLPALLASAATAGCPREQRPEGADE